MKLRDLSLLLFLASTMMSFAQPANWIYDTKKSNFYDRVSALGQIEAGENTIAFVENNKILETSYYGELVKETIFDIVVTPIDQLGAINKVFRRNFNGQDIYILSIVRPGSRHYFSIFTLDSEQLGERFELEESADNIDSEMSATLLEADNKDLIVFSREVITTYTLQDDLTWIQTNILAHDFNVITTASKVANGYFITTKEGKGALLNTDFETIWQNDIGHKLENVLKNDDGFFLCGTDPDNEVAYITKLDNAGNQLWQQSFEGRAAHQISPYNNNYLIGGIDLYSIDANGELLWNKELPSKSGVYHILPDAYDGILLQTRDANLRIDLSSQTPFEKYNSLSTNNIETHISAWGNFDVYNGAIQYPIGEQTSTVYVNEPIFVGQKENGALKGFFEPYSLGEEFIGLPQNVAGSDNTLWKITQKEIDLIQDELETGESLEPYSHSMLTYPGKGNPNCIINGEIISIDNDFAPFVDVNNDGIYNMFDGDYPEMKGDQMIWWAIKDTVSEMEIHGRWYAYQCGDHIVSNTVYVDYKIINKSTDNLSNCRFGKFVDWDLGCHADDFFGSMPNANAIFAYNKDAIDGIEGGMCFGSLEYGDQIPVQAMTLLSEDMASSIYFNRGGATPASEPATTDPANLEEVNHFLHARFRDGTPLTQGGTGYNPDQTAFIQHAFPGNPSETNEWSMYQEDLNVGDRRSIVATSDFDLAAGVSKSFSLAFTTYPDIAHPGPDVSEIEQSLLDLSTFFDDGNAFSLLNLGQDLMIASDESLSLDAGDGAQSYQWSTGETTSTISIDNPGTYAVTIVDETGCQRTDDINVSLATGVLDLNRIEQLSMYPNPIAKGQLLTIELGENRNLAAIKVFNLLGQEVQSQLINTFSNTVELKVNASLSTGIYLLQLSLANGQLMSGKMMVK